MKNFNLTLRGLEELSLVDRGANQHAHIKLIKSDSACSQGNCTDPACSKCKTGKRFDGVRLVVGYNKTGDLAIHDVVFGKGWEKEDAANWLGYNRIVKGDKEVAAPFRFVSVGGEFLKALRQADSISEVQEEVDRAVRAKYQPTNGAQAYDSYCFVRDLFLDNVVFEQGGETWRAPYTVERVDGELKVTVGDRVEVEVVYQDKNLAAPDELVKALEELKLRYEKADTNPAHYAYVPDKEKPSTWKLRLYDANGKMTARQVGMAIAAITPPDGFRGNLASIPSKDMAGVKSKLRSAWRSANPDKDASEMPSIIKA